MVKSFLLAALATTAFVAAPSAQAATTITGTGAGMILPILGTGTHNSTISVASAGVVTDVVFTLKDLAYGAARNLTLSVSHNGVTASLLSGATGLASLRPVAGTYSFTDDAGTLMKDGPGLTHIWGGTYQYSYTVPGSFAGQLAAGDWTLSVTDGSRLNGGFLKNWSLSITAVPEPTTWAMMIAGFAFVGAAMRRRQTQLSFA